FAILASGHRHIHQHNRRDKPLHQSDCRRTAILQAKPVKNDYRSTVLAFCNQVRSAGGDWTGETLVKPGLPHGIVSQPCNTARSVHFFTCAWPSAKAIPPALL